MNCNCSFNYLRAVVEHRLQRSGAFVVQQRYPLWENHHESCWWTLHSRRSPNWLDLLGGNSENKTTLKYILKNVRLVQRNILFNWYSLFLSVIYPLLFTCSFGAAQLLFHCYSLFLSVIYHFYLPLSLYLPFCWGTVVEVRAKVGPHSLWEQPCWPVVMLEQRGCPVLMSWSVKLHLQQLLSLQLVHGCGVDVLQQTHLHVAGLLQGTEDSIYNKK